jgi:hypothetical protein
MKLAAQSMTILRQGTSIAAKQLKALTAATASGRLTYEEANHIAWQLRVAASQVEAVSGRLFYAKGKKR